MDLHLLVLNIEPEMVMYWLATQTRANRAITYPRQSEQSSLYRVSIRKAAAT